MITYNHKYEQFVASGFLDFESLMGVKTIEKGVPTLAPGTILFNKKGKFFFQLLGELKLPAPPATLVGYMPGSIIFQGPEIPYFKSVLRDCYLPDIRYLAEYNKGKSI